MLLEKIIKKIVAKTISGNQLQQIINFSINHNPTYNLNTYNCTDFVIEIGNIMGIGLPDCYSTFGAGGGSNPAALGQYIRNNFSTNATYTVNKSGGTAPTNYKGC